MSKFLFCPNCGNKVQPNAKFCSACGTRFNAGSSVDNKLSSISPAKASSNKISGGNNIKRSKVLNSGRSNNNRKNIYVWLAAAVIIIGAIWHFASQPSKEEQIIDKQPKVTGNVAYPDLRYDLTYTLAYAKGDKIILPLDLVKEKKLVKFDFSDNGETFPLLAYLTEDGKVVTTISMCEPCNSTSFHIIGKNIICNTCGTSWNLNTLKPVSGSCSKYPPDPIPSSVVGNEIQIDKSLVDNWSRRI